jgi:CsoR family transcriptional regulator, copper-sensing transcriptional repressor
MRNENSKKAALNRLATIEGHLKGIRKMVEEDLYCVDILKQTYAVKRAIDGFESAMLRDHLESCVLEGVREGRDQEVLGELAELLELSRRAQT